MSQTNSAPKLEIISGFIDHTIFRNKDNGYTIMVLDTGVTVTGYFPSIADGEHLSLEGNFVFHPTYGEQFNAKSYEVVAPKDEEDIRRYLSSGAIKGVGPALAKRIVDKFGEDTFRIMESEPERLAEVKGISERKAIEIAESVVAKSRDRTAILFLLQYGINNNLAVKILNTYGQDLYFVLKNNPYKLAEDIKGIGFKQADEIAINQGIKIDSEERVKSGLLYVLSLASINGHTYFPKESLYEHGRNLLSVGNESIDSALMHLVIEKKVILREENIWLYYYYYMEQESANMLSDLNIELKSDRDTLDRYLERSEEEEGMKLDDIQKEAVYMATCSGVMVITGGPGTGKTTTIKTIIKYFENTGKTLSLCAPTGRAAKRMTESAGRPAVTIHRLLEVSSGIEEEPGKESKVSFGRNEEHPLETDVVIVDEASMVDIKLFYSLLKAIKINTHLILVGDINQLPSVGPGNVLKDIIESQQFRVVKLINIFRQGTRSDIVINAHKIQTGEDIILDNESKDFFFLKQNDYRQIMRDMISLVKNKLPSYVKAPESEIQILSPTRKGNLGVVSLNEEIQKYLNPEAEGKSEQSYGERIFRVGDKVMQIKNDYGLPWRIEGKGGYSVEEGSGVYNGDIGEIVDIDKAAKFITVLYDGERLVDYPFQQLEELEHAYAITVHKSQGSEYPAVIIPLLNIPYMLQNRNLIYTAITRAKKCVVIIGDENIFFSMVNNDKTLNRYSGLKEAIIFSSKGMDEV